MPSIQFNRNRTANPHTKIFTFFYQPLVGCQCSAELPDGATCSYLKIFTNVSGQCFFNINVFIIDYIKKYVPVGDGSRASESGPSEEHTSESRVCTELRMFFGLRVHPYIFIFVYYIIGIYIFIKFDHGLHPA